MNPEIPLSSQHRDILVTPLVSLFANVTLLTLMSATFTPSYLTWFSDDYSFLHAIRVQLQVDSIGAFCFASHLCQLANHTAVKQSALHTSSSSKQTQNLVSSPHLLTIRPHNTGRRHDSRRIIDFNELSCSSRFHCWLTPHQLHAQVEQNTRTLLIALSNKTPQSAVNTPWQNAD